ncbi:hypothetical protein A2U01_0077230, partial [Trifolium medium]|nr:hypothetical protein [Trifolium medium]
MSHNQCPPWDEDPPGAEKNWSGVLTPDTLHMILVLQQSRSLSLKMP